MKKAAMEAWVKALRSGHFEQGKGQLVTEDGKLCCLGVACYIVGYEVVFDEFSEHLLDSNVFNGTCGDLPESIQVEFGMKSSNGNRGFCYDVIIDGNHYESLAQANDSGVSFEKIAGYIEKHWRNL